MAKLFSLSFLVVVTSFIALVATESEVDLVTTTTSPFIETESNNVTTTTSPFSETESNNNVTTTSFTEEPMSSVKNMTAIEAYFESFHLGNTTKECEVQLKKTDSCMRQLMILVVDEDKVVIPKTMEEVDYYCG